MKDEEILKGSANTELNRYFILEAQSNWQHEISVLLGGSIGASINSELQDTASSNWKVSVLNKYNFSKRCN